MTMTADMEHFYIGWVETINAAATEKGHRELDKARGEFMAQIRSQFGDNVAGRILMAADWHYISQGIERPTCGGVFLDWEPMVDA
jgi:hypothetical protein